MATIETGSPMVMGGDCFGGSGFIDNSTDTV